MKIAVISEVSAVNRNPDIMAALDNRGYEIINVGMKDPDGKPQLTYIHTGLIAAILLNLKKVDFVVGGCGTGQGFSSSCMQYPGVFCGLLLNPLDAWLFTQINGGNCISLALTVGYGWASDVNLKFIIDKFFSVKRGGGYPEHRVESQKESRQNLEIISELVHRPFYEIIEIIPDNIISPVINFPGLKEIIDIDSIDDTDLKAAFRKRFN